jgi:hypothetical protein
MDIQRLLTGLSLKIIIQFFVVIGAGIALVTLNFDLIYPFYFENQLTNTGIFINSGILGLLIIGLGNIFYHLLRYRREEIAIAGFVNNVESIKIDLLEGLPADSMVVKRQLTMQSIQKSHGEINHGALAAMLNADEATHFGLIRFINNILILTGVFGTIVSLSIALIGASDLIDSANASLGGMGLVIHGMSTALSTTITAIVSYIIFGYFYTRLNDVQTHCLSGIEQLTTVYLLPRYVKASDDIVHKLADLIKSVIHATDKLKKTQDTYQEAAITLNQTITTNQQQVDQLVDEIHGIKQILRDGFRLPLADEES